MTMMGSQILVEGLIEAGVEFIFGYPGGAVIPLFDSLMDYEPDEIKLILTRSASASQQMHRHPDQPANPLRHQAQFPGFLPHL